MRYEQYVPSVNPHQINTAESSPTEARYRSPGDHPTSVTSCATSQQSTPRASARTRTALMSHQSLQGLPPLDIHLVRAPHLSPRRPAEHTAVSRSPTLHESSTRHSRVEVPYHHDLVVAAAREPPARVRPAHDEHRARVHRERAERLRRAPGELGGVVEDRLRAPDAHLRVEAARRDAGAVRVDVAGENGDAFLVPAHGGVCA